jgi:hypothetical protein
MSPKLGDGEKLIRLANASVKQAEYNFNLYRKKLEYVSKIEKESKDNGYATVEEYLPKRTIRGSLHAWLMAKGYTDKFRKEYDLEKGPEDESRLEQISRSSRSSRSRSSSSRSRSNQSASSWPGIGSSRRRLRLKSRRA